MIEPDAIHDVWIHQNRRRLHKRGAGKTFSTMYLNDLADTA